MLFSWSSLRARLTAVLHLNDAPWKIALGLAVGVFISCTPFYGLHTVMALLAAYCLRLNKASTVTGAWLNLPWFAPFLYGFALKVGEFIMSGGQGLPEMRGQGLGELVALIRPLLSLDKLKEGFLASSKLLFMISKPLLVGTTVVGFVASVVTYFVALEAVREIRSLANVDPSPPASSEEPR